MILRRLTTALRKQDWFTVVIETLIVVLGVFLGIQLGNWNSARLAEAEADDLLSRMIIEADEARDDMADYRHRHDQILESALKLSVRLKATEDCLAMDDEMKIMILGVGDFPPPRFSLATASEAVASGKLSGLGASDIQDKVRQIIDEMRFIDRQWQRYVDVKLDSERAIYTAAGLNLLSENVPDVLTGAGWSGIEQYDFQTPEGVCGNPEMAAFATSAALTQSVYTNYLEEVSDRLDLYAADLAAAGAGNRATQEATP